MAHGAVLFLLVLVRRVRMLPVRLIREAIPPLMVRDSFSSGCPWARRLRRRRVC
jgi:hypothetical protein